ncbi:hypothetical protein Q5O24_13700 [Eubacteriaceae bacterium ES3]|nr:hypothetical protein Q5O24_13700 [Eubacteriaceae bacterium ES3]
MTKKLMAGLAVLMMVGSAGTVMAAPQAGAGACDGTGVGIGNDGVAQYQFDGTYDENFVDEDGDGVCDTEPQFLEYHRGQR